MFDFIIFSLPKADSTTALQREVCSNNGGMIGNGLMDKRASHRLARVDLGERTAVCSICGPTQISVRVESKHPDRKPHIMCINRYREIVRESQRRRRLQARLQNPNWKPKHSLSEVDPDKMRGVCAICGPTDILEATTYHKLTYYRCATNFRKYARDYSHLSYKPKS